MKKFLSLCLALLMMLSLATTAFANAPTGGENAQPSTAVPADEVYTFDIQKKYVKDDGSKLAKVPVGETIKFQSTPSDKNPGYSAGGTNSNLTVGDLTTEDEKFKYDVPVTIPAGTFTQPGKYNFTITEVKPANQKPAGTNTQGVTYDEDEMYIQVLVTYNEEGKLVEQVTFAQNADAVGEATQPAGNKKGDFNNKYKLDGDGVTPKPNPSPEPSPNPDELPVPGTDPRPEASGKLSVTKAVNGKMGNTNGKFKVDVYLYSKLPVRSDITYGGSSTVAKYDGTNDGAKADGKWYKFAENDYRAKVTLTLGHGDTVVFENIPEGVQYAVKEQNAHIGKLIADNINVADKGYTVRYISEGDLKSMTGDSISINIDEVGTNPNKKTAPDSAYGQKLYVTGIIGTTSNNNVYIINTKGENNEDVDIVKPNTGISLDSVPYIMILTLVVACTAFIFVGKKKRTED